jgi:hypothetical protein
MRVWHNIAASNNAWSCGVTPALLAAIAKESPAVQVFDLSDESLIGVTSKYEIRADGCELWAELELEREPGGERRWHGESVLAKEPDGSVKLCAVALTTMPRGWVAASLAVRYPGRVVDL